MRTFAEGVTWKVLLGTHAMAHCNKSSAWLLIERDNCGDRGQTRRLRSLEEAANKTFAYSRRLGVSMHYSNDQPRLLLKCGRPVHISEDRRFYNSTMVYVSGHPLLVQLLCSLSIGWRDYNTSIIFLLLVHFHWLCDSCLSNCVLSDNKYQPSICYRAICHFVHLQIWDQHWKRGYWQNGKLTKQGSCWRR